MLGYWETLTKPTLFSAPQKLMEDLSNRWKSLSLSEKEESGLTLNSDQATSEFSMLARFLTRRPINLDSIANTFNPLWRSKSGFRMKFIGDHLILFSFDSKEEVDRILAAEPWSFDKSIMVLSRHEHSNPINAVNMSMVSFWVQVHDIPIRFRNREVGEKICENIGMIIKTENPLECDGGSFIRIRVKVNIDLPLCRGRLITLENNEAHWVSFKYERLPNLCYWCGRLTHPDKDCERWIDSEGTLNKEEQHFGPWLKAAPFTVSRKAFLSVPGFYASKKTGKKGQEHAGSTPNQHGSPLSPASETPPTLAAEIQEPEMSTKSLAHDVKFTSNSPKSQPFSDTEILEPSLSALPMKYTSQPDFEQIIADIDEDIRCFDKVDLGAPKPSEPQPGPSQQSGNGPSPAKDPTIKTPSSLMDPNPLKDISNHPPAQGLLNPGNEKRWLRIQRPTHAIGDENTEISLGKRGALPTSENSNSQKRRAVTKDASTTPLPQTAAAGTQPRRSR